ncbi:MAG: hypothetical protein ABL895_06750 [Cyclobacteriaceae bacterium]
MRSGCFLFILIAALAACSSEDPVNPDTGLNYFPLKTGESWIYQVEETLINQSIESVINYDLRVTVTDSTKNSSGGYTYILHRETKASGTNPWQPLDTWSASLLTNQMTQNESNTVFVKLIFPPASGLKWNGNQYNNLPDNGNVFNGKDSETYQVTDFDKSLTLDTGLEYPKTLTVIQNNFTDGIVGRDERSEVYALDVGLIYKEVIQLEYCTTPSCLGQQKVDKGVIYRQTLKAYASQ